MDYEIVARPSYSMLRVDLTPGDKLVTESKAMAWMDTNVRAQTSTRGGVLSGLKRKLLTGESFFQNTYEAEGGPGSITLAPGSAGDVVAMPLDGELYLEKGAFLASTEGVKCDAKFGGLRGFFNEGLFVLRCSGSGTLFFNAYGEIQEVDVDGQYTVDNGYAVAWEPHLDYRLTKARKIRSFLFSDQILLRFSGRGKVWVQSRSAAPLANWIHQFRPVKVQSDD
ncbi:MAG: TIGR00266 family protein [Planctomycetota bacterium]